MKLYQKITSTLNAMENCRKNSNAEWLERHEEALEWCENQLPSGSGIDSGTTINHEKSNDSRLWLDFGFHFMDDNGCYAGWGDFSCVVKPSLLFDITVDIKGRNRRGIKDYLLDTYNYILTREVVTDSDGNLTIGYS